MQSLQGLLGVALAGLSPKEPNVLDKLFGRFADPQHTYAQQLDFALLLLGVMVLALIWRVFRQRVDLRASLPQLDAKLSDEKTRTWAERVVTAALVFVALLASVNYFYGTRNNGVYVHRWDAFHTVIGVKYHEELGYFDLYKCAYAIDKEGPRHFRSSKDIRDLRTRKFEPSDQHVAGNDCKQRFTPERLEEFKHDLDQFGKFSNRSQWKILFKDKGFNGTPFYATVCKFLISTIEVDLDGLKRLAAIDPILMFIAFGVVGWAFGARQAAIMAIFFCVFFPNRFVHMGGSILRFDYVATLMIGFSALKKDKWGLAGAMFAWATMIRVFPAIFAVGVGFKIVTDVAERIVRDRQLPAKDRHSPLALIRPEHWRFVGFFAGGLILFFLISLVGMHGGFDNWRTWAENMKIHNARSASFRVGFKHLFMADGKLTSNAYGPKQANLEARSAYYWASVAVLFAPLVIAVRRLDVVSFGTMFGVFGFFLLAVATRYYYGVVALLFLIDREPLKNRYLLIMGAVLFLSTAIDFAYFELNDSDALMYNTIIGIEMTVVIALMGSWLLFNPTLQDLGEDPRLSGWAEAKVAAKPAPAAEADAGAKPDAKPDAEPAPADVGGDTDGDTDAGEPGESVTVSEDDDEREPDGPA